MLIFIFKLLKWQRDSFADMIAREEYYNFGGRAEDDEMTLTKLTRLTTMSLVVFTLSYEYKLLLRIGTTIFYTHGFYNNFDGDTVSWVFFGLTTISIVLTLWSGLIFLQFASIMHMAHTHKSLFDSGLNVDETEDVDVDAIIN